MKTLLVDIESTANLQAFMDVVKNLGFVKSVKMENSTGGYSTREVKEKMKEWAEQKSK